MTFYKANEDWTQSDEVISSEINSWIQRIGGVNLAVGKTIVKKFFIQSSDTVDVLAYLRVPYEIAFMNPHIVRSDAATPDDLTGDEVKHGTVWIQNAIDQSTLRLYDEAIYNNWSQDIDVPVSVGDTIVLPNGVLRSVTAVGSDADGHPTITVDPELDDTDVFGAAFSAAVEHYEDGTAYAHYLFLTIPAGTPQPDTSTAVINMEVMY